MQYQRLGNSELRVSRIGFGGASISGEGKGYGFGAISTEESIRLIRHAYDLGINLFDTAPIYGFGESEKRIGVAVKSFRDKVTIVSKSGVHWHDNGRVDMNNDPKITHKMLEDSLRRLDSDYIDLYMVHWPDEKWDIRYPLEVIHKAQATGKVKYIGLCNTTVDDLAKAQEVCKISALQCEHNLFTQAKFNELAESMAKMDLGFMSWGSLDKGILTGRVVKDRKYDKEDARSWAPWWNKKEVDSKLEKMQKLRKHLPDQNLLELALGLCLAEEKLTSALCGARSEEQLDKLIEAANHIPNAQTLVEAQEILSGVL